MSAVLSVWHFHCLFCLFSWQSSGNHGWWSERIWKNSENCGVWANSWPRYYNYFPWFNIEWIWPVTVNSLLYAGNNGGLSANRKDEKKCIEWKLNLAVDGHNIKETIGKWRMNNNNNFIHSYICRFTIYNISNLRSGQKNIVRYTFESG